MIYIVTTYRGALASVTVTEAYTETKAYKGGAVVYVFDDAHEQSRIIDGTCRSKGMRVIPNSVLAAVDELRAERRA